MRKFITTGSTAGRQWSRGLKHFQTVIFPLLALLTAASLRAEDSDASFRAPWRQSMGMSAISTASAPRALLFEYEATTVNGRRSISDPYAMRTIGGIIFVEEAQPADGVSAQCPVLKYSAGAPNGKRLVVQIGGRAVSGSLYDWELYPTEKFVQSGKHGLFTDMGNAQYHPAFFGVLAGVNLFFIDETIDIRNFQAVHTGLTRSDIPGYTPDVEVGSEVSARLMLSELRNSFKIPGASQLMFTDYDVRFTYRPSGDRLDIDGYPYWAALGRVDEAGNGRILWRMKDSTLPLRANPVVYGSVFRVSRYAAFFRHVQAKCPSQWASFDRSMDSNRERIDLIRFREMPTRISSFADAVTPQ